MAHENNSSLKVFDSVGQGIDGLHVEMVGGLVEEEHVGHLMGEVGKHHPALLTVRELLHGGGLRLSCDAVTPYYLKIVKISLN